LGEVVARSVEALGQDGRLDGAALPVGDAVRDALDRQPLKDVLSGTWLGHPLHPLLTDLPIGFWTSAFTLDLVGGRSTRRAATQLVGWGVVAAVPTALSGAADWGDTTGVSRRIGLVHAAANTTALACYAASLWSRVRGRHTRGVALGLLGATAATVGGYLGGHLLQTLGVGVDQTAFARPPADWTLVAADTDVTETPRRVLAGEAPVLVFRRHGAVLAIDARCPHRGAPLDEGETDEECITCPWHGSVFRVTNGELVRGPATVDLPVYECRVSTRGVEVRAR
jgi:nitrite reductase/ring-hydroxylating ferredoxin subunit/uncharacterized membrane protein